VRGGSLTRLIVRVASPFPFNGNKSALLGPQQCPNNPLIHFCTVVFSARGGRRRDACSRNRSRGCWPLHHFFAGRGWHCGDNCGPTSPAHIAAADAVHVACPTCSGTIRAVIESVSPPRVQEKAPVRESPLRDAAHRTSAGRDMMPYST